MDYFYTATYRRSRGATWPIFAPALTLHDENKNGEMDTNAFGIPKEGYGSSNNVVTHLHAPSFDQSKFQLSASGQKTSISMRY